MLSKRGHFSALHASGDVYDLVRDPFKRAVLCKQSLHKELLGLLGRLRRPGDHGRRRTGTEDKG